MEVRLSHSIKARSPICVKVSGSVREVIFLHPAKTSSYMCVNVSGS
jgi:hypothetical protein